MYRSVRLQFIRTDVRETTKKLKLCIIKEKRKRKTKTKSDKVTHSAQ